GGVSGDLTREERTAAGAEARAADAAAETSPVAGDAAAAHSPGPGIGPDAADPSVAGLWRALKDVLDPEFPISVVDLGLIYGIRREGGRVEVDLTFTATA